MGSRGERHPRDPSICGSLHSKVSLIEMQTGQKELPDRDRRGFKKDSEKAEGMDRVLQRA